MATIQFSGSAISNGQITLPYGSSATLTLHINPYHTPTFTNSDPGAATIGVQPPNTGQSPYTLTIRALTLGTTTITCTAGGATAELRVTVEPRRTGEYVVLEYIVDRLGGQFAWYNMPRFAVATINGRTWTFREADHRVDHGVLLVDSGYVMSAFGLSEAPKHEPYGFTLLRVADPGAPRDSYEKAVRAWAELYARTSYGIEYGAIIYSFIELGQTRYFMGETYQGFKMPGWYTVFNGLGAGLLVSIAESWLGNSTQIEDVKVIGFAHTHPVNSPNGYKPSDPWDLRMQQYGWIAGLKAFPISYFCTITGNVNTCFKWYQ